MKKWILFLDDESLAAYHRQNRQWICADRFVDTPEDLSRFASFLQAHSRSNFMLLADLGGEEIISASIPKTRGSDRQALIERKQEQLFPGRLLRMATALTGEAEANREPLLFSSFASQEQFTPWLSRISASHCRLTGIFSASQLLGRTLKEKHKQDSDCLLLLHKGTTLRQYFLRQGEVRFCRTASVTQDQTSSVAHEVLKLQQYLLSQRLIERGKTLPVLIACCSTTHSRRADAQDFQQLPEREKFFNQLFDSLSRRTPKVQFAPTNLLHVARQARIRNALNLLSALVLCISLPATAFHILEIERLHDETGAIEPRLAVLQRESASIKQESMEAPSTIDLRYLKESTTHRQGTENHLQNALFKLSQVLDQHPEIQLEKLDWRSEIEQETLLIEGRLSSGSASARTRFEHFMAALQVDRDSRVKRLQSIAVDETTEILRGNSRENAPALRNFIIEIQRHP